MLDINKIYNQDCLEGMKLIDDGSVDMILCDLPYGTTQCKWDSIIPLDRLWLNYERIIKRNGAIVLFSQSPFDKVLAYSNLKLLKYELIWQKTQATGFLNSKKMPLKSHENILVFYKATPIYNPQKTTIYNEHEFVSYDSTERYPRSILTFPKDTQKEALHPTQKPLALCEYLIKTYTNENNLVMDNCIGSGTTAVSCINTNRNFIGFELDENYYDIAQKRIENL